MADKPHLDVEFFTEAVELPARSRDEGRPIFEDQEFVRVRIAGDPKNTLVAPALLSLGMDPTGEPITYASRFPEHYKLFKAGVGAPIIGTPLAEMPWLTASKIKELQALNIKTVEALAELEGSALQRLGMGGRELKNQASTWLDRAAGAAGDARLAAELSKRDDLIASLQAQIAALAGGKSTEAVVEPEVIQPDDGSDQSLGENSPFWAWEDTDIKAWMKDNGGTVPTGNASHKTIVARADALNAELAAKQQRQAA